MQVEIKIDEACTEPKIIILTDRMTDEVSSIVKKLSDDTPQILSGFRDDTLEILEQNDIFRFYASAGRIIAETDNGEYTLRLRLYELEGRLDKSRFVRISNSEIVNIRKVRKFDLSLQARYAFPCRTAPLPTFQGDMSIKSNKCWEYEVSI